MKNTIEDEDKLGSKISSEDKDTISEAIKETLDWLEDHGESEKAELQEQLKKLEGVCNPIVTKLYQESGGAPGGAGGSGGGGYYDEEDDMPDHDEL